MARIDLRWLLPAAVAVAGCTGHDEGVALGYVEADYVRLAAPIGGQLAQLHLQRGQTVAAGAPAFTLEQDSERAGQQEAQRRVQQAQSELADQQLGRRPDEIRALQAQLQQAQAALVASTAVYQRSLGLVPQGVSAAELDERRAGMQRDQGRVEELTANLRQARQGGRSNQLQAARDQVAAAQAQADQARWRVEQKTRTVPVAAEVVDTLYREGEYVPAGSPVVTLLPPGNIKARFFVPELVAGGLRLGQRVEIRCDGCGGPIGGHITFLSPEAEYTAPVIYSREQRAKLVVMAEARPDAAQAQRLRPGQPLEVRLVRSGP